MPWLKDKFHWPIAQPYCMQVEAADAVRRLQREAEYAARQQRKAEADEEAWLQQQREDAEEAWQLARQQRAQLISSYTTREIPNTGSRQSAVEEWSQQLREARWRRVARHGLHEASENQVS